MLYRFKFSMLIVVVMMALLAVGCSSDENTVQPAVEKSKIRVIHTSYDAPAVDISVDGVVAISGLSYGKSSGYAEINSGVREIKVTPAGMSTPVVIQASLPVEANREYTIIATDELTSITPVVVVDNRAPNSQKAKIRFMHSSPDAPAVDIKVGSGSSAPVFSNAAFGDVTSYVEVDAGSYQFVVTAAGSADELLVFNPVMVQNGGVYTVIAHGTLSDENYPFATRVFVDNDPGDAFVDLTFASTNIMVIHASPDAPGVDLLIDNEVVNSMPLLFLENTGYLPILAGTRNIKVNAAGTSVTVIDATVSLPSDSYFSIFAVNSLASIQPLVLVDDLTPPAAGKAHVRFVHLSPDAPAVDITLTDGTVVFGNKAFTEYSEFTPLDAGTYDLQVRLYNTDTVVLELPGITIENGRIYTVFAKGYVSGSGDQALGAEIIVNM